MSLCVPGRSFAIDPIEELGVFSKFQNIDLQKLAEGEILVARGNLMEFSRGITAQACFVVMAPAEKVARLYQMWEASNNEELKIYIHRIIHSPPSDEDFSSLDLRSQEHPFGWLVAKTQAVSLEQTDLFLSRMEMAQIYKRLNMGGEPIAVVTQCWKDILKARALKFQKEGLAGLPPYEVGEEVITIQSEIQKILKERPKTKAQFSSLIAETISGKPPSQSTLTPYCYWDLVGINSHPTFNLGAIYIMSLGNDRYQGLDLSYYSSSGIYVSATFRQIWPIKIGNKNASLVWRGEEVSAPELENVHGMERIAAGSVMLQEIKKSVRAFQEDVLKAP